MSEHLIHLQQVFDRLLQAGLKLQPKKCQFLKPEVQYLGHIVSRQGISPDPAKIDKDRLVANPKVYQRGATVRGLSWLLPPIYPFTG